MKLTIEQAIKLSKILKNQPNKNKHIDNFKDDIIVDIFDETGNCETHEIKPSGLTNIERTDGFKKWRKVSK